MTESRDQVFPDASGSSRTRRIVLEFESFRDFIQAFSPVVSEEGMFVAAGQLPDGLPGVGEELDFEVRLTDDFRLVHGHGDVAWVREVDDSAGSAGVAVRFVDLDEPSRRLLSRLLANYTKDGGRPFDLEAGRPVAGDLTVEPEPLARTEADELFMPSLENLEPEPELLDAIAPVPAVVDESMGVGDQTDEEMLSSLPTVEEATDGVESISEGYSVPAAAVSELGALEDDAPAIELDVPEIDLPEVELPEIVMPEVDLAEFDVQPLEEAVMPEPVKAETVPDKTEPLAAEPVISEEIAQVAEELSGVHRPQPVEMPSEEDSVSIAGSGQASEDKPAWRMPFLAGLAGIAVAVAVWTFAGDQIKSLIGLGEAGGSIEVVMPQEPVADEMPALPDSSSPGAVAESEPGESLESEAASMTAESGEAAIVERRQESGDDERLEARTPQVAAASVSRVERITWDITDEETVVSILFDAAVNDSSYEVVRIRQGAPREVIKVFGVSSSATPKQLEVGSSHVVRLRSGIHAGETGREVHIVADLTGPAAAVTLVRVEDRTIVVTFS